jgi:3-oxoacyl-[acyl-carrier protein] reductase
LSALRGRSALVTGAGSPEGIGFTCARALSDLGATVHVTSTTDRIHERATELGSDSIGVVADLAITSDVDALPDAVGDVDVVVNSAGMVSVGSPDLLALVTAMSYDEWRADEVGGSGVTCNAVAPGWIATGSQSASEAAHGLRSAAGRSCTADEVAAAVAFLASPGASYITGHCLVVDGGNSVLESR